MERGEVKTRPGFGRRAYWSPPSRACSFLASLLPVGAVDELRKEEVAPITDIADDRPRPGSISMPSRTFDLPSDPAATAPSRLPAALVVAAFGLTPVDVHVGVIGAVRDRWLYRRDPCMPRGGHADRYPGRPPDVKLHLSIMQVSPGIRYVHSCTFSGPAQGGGWRIHA